LANNDAQLGQPGYDLAGSNIDRNTSDANANLATLPALGLSRAQYGDHLGDGYAGWEWIAAPLCRLRLCQSAHQPGWPVPYENRFRVWMPVDWTDASCSRAAAAQRHSSCRDYGSINANPSFGIINGYAVATQDGGHFSTEPALPTCDSGYGNPTEFYLDPLGATAFAYQLIAVTTLTAKYLIIQFCGDGPRHAQWAGYSPGGRQGMVMSQNFLSFFDAGAPS
jgi:hypothetical protein